MKKLRNLDSLVIVAIILIVLGCKCNSDLFKSISGGNAESNVAINSSAPLNKDGNTFESSNSNTSGNDSPVFSNTNKTGENTPRVTTTLDRLPVTVGDFERIKADKGDPAKEGFETADEVVTGEYSYKNQIVKSAVAKYATAAEAEQTLKTQLAELKKQGAKTSEVLPAANNSGVEIGVSATAEGKGNLVIIWTNGNFLQIAYGPKKETEEFFAAYDVP